VEGHDFEVPPTFKFVSAPLGEALTVAHSDVIAFRARTPLWSMLSVVPAHQLCCFRRQSRKFSEDGVKPGCVGAVGPPLGA